MKDREGPIAFSPELWDERQIREMAAPSMLAQMHIGPPNPRVERRTRHWRRRTWRLREALRGLRMGWKGELE